MEAELEDMVEEDIDLNSPIPCRGLDTVLRDGTPIEQFSCDKPATWRCTVYCCGARSSFSCDPHKRYDDLYGTQCARCNTRPIEVFWRRI